MICTRRGFREGSCNREFACMKSRRTALIASVLAAGVAVALWTAPALIFERLNPAPPPPARAPVPEVAATLHDSLLVVDLHADALLWDRDLLERSMVGHVDLPRLIEGRVAVQLFTAVTKVPRGMNLEANDADSDLITPLALVQLWPPATWWSPLARALHQADKLRGFAAGSGGRLSVVTSRDELKVFLETRDRNERTVAALLGLEGAHALEGELANVDILFAAGYRMLGLTHFFDNAVGGSAHGVRKGGLTDFGGLVLDRMAELGMLVDLAHASDPLIDDVTSRARGPVVVSHTGVDGTCPGPRNLGDEQLLQIAGTGGVVGIGLWPEAVCGETPRDWARAVRYTADLVGVEHVALGSDWDGAVPAIVDAAGTEHLTAALLDEGFSSEEIRAILGGNTLRVLLATLPAARSSRRGSP
jgi:membrane dipeptidase